MGLTQERISSDRFLTEVESAWKQLPENIRLSVARWGDQALEDIFEAARKSIDPMVSESSFGRRARDRVKATIASEAYKGVLANSGPADKELFDLVLQSMRQDMANDAQIRGKES